MAERANNMENSDYIAISVSIAVVVGLALSSLALLPHSPPNLTPESTLNAFYDRLNSEDARGALNYTHLALAIDHEDYQMFLDIFEEAFQYYDYYATIENINVTYREELNLNIIPAIDEFVDGLMYFYEISVDDYCTITYIETTINGEREESWLCIEVDSLWYIVFGYDYPQRTPRG